MHDDRIDLYAIDLRSLPPEHRDAVMREATRRAHVERSRVFRDLAGKATQGAAGWIRRLLSAGRPAKVAG